MRLAAPLEFRWAVKGVEAVVGSPLVKGNCIIAHRGERWSMICLDLNGSVRWRLPPEANALAITGRGVWARVKRRGAGSLILVALPEGKVYHEEPLPHGIALVLSGAEEFIERRWPEPELALRILTPGCPIRWTRRFGTGQPAVRIDRRMAGGSDRCFVLVHGDRNEASLFALSLENGAETWSTSVTDIDEPAPEGRWRPLPGSGLLVFRTKNGTAALSQTDGRLAWYAKEAGSNSVHRDRLYAIGMNWKAAGQPSEIVALDIHDGHVVWRRDYPEILGKARDNRLTGRLVASETQIFAGDDGGTVWAFDIRNGEPVWHHHPKGSEAFPPWIEGVHPRRKTTRSSPHFAEDGGWTVLECGLETQGRFFLAFKATAPSGDGYVWVSRAGDGEAVLRAVPKAFPLRGVRRMPPASRARPPRRLDVTMLGSELDETGSGRGSWTASKWTGDDGVPEFYVNWSVAEKRGWITEKDDTYRKSLLTLFASLVVR